MAERTPDTPAERVVRRTGMTAIVVLIVWTIVAVTVGVVRGLTAPDAPPSMQGSAEDG